MWDGQPCSSREPYGRALPTGERKPWLETASCFPVQGQLGRMEIPHLATAKKKQQEWAEREQSLNNGTTQALLQTAILKVGMLI